MKWNNTILSSHRFSFSTHFFFVWIRSFLCSNFVLRATYSYVFILLHNIVSGILYMFACKHDIVLGFWQDDVLLSLRFSIKFNNRQRRRGSWIDVNWLFVEGWCRRKNLSSALILKNIFADVGIIIFEILSWKSSSIST